MGAHKLQDTQNELNPNVRFARMRLQLGMRFWAFSDPRFGSLRTLRKTNCRQATEHLFRPIPSSSCCLMNENKDSQQEQYLLSLFGLSNDCGQLQNSHPILNANEEQEQIYEENMRPLVKHFQSESYSDMDLLSVFGASDATVIDSHLHWFLTM